MLNESVFWSIVMEQDEENIDVSGSYLSKEFSKYWMTINERYSTVITFFSES